MIEQGGDVDLGVGVNAEGDRAEGDREVTFSARKKGSNSSRRSCTV